MKKSSTRRDKRKQQPSVPRSQRNRDDSEADLDHENDRMHVKQDSSDTVKSSTKVKFGENPTPTGLLENGASISDGSEPAVAVVAESTSSVVVDDEKDSSPARVDSPALEAKIRLVSLNKLLRPSLVNIVANEEESTDKDRLSKSKRKSSNFHEKDKSVSIIELSDDSDEDEKLPQFIVRKHPNRMEDANEVVASGSTSSVRSTSSNRKPANGGCAATTTPSTKELSIVVKRMPTNLGALKASFGLSEIRDHHNRLIEKFVSNSNRYTQNRTGDGKAKEAKNMANAAEQQSKASNSKVEEHRQEDGSEVEEIARNDSDSDAPIGRNRNKTKSSIPIERKNTRNTRKRRAVSDSEDEKSTGKPAAASTNGGNTDEQSEASSSELEFTKSNTATSRNRRAAERSKRTATSKATPDGNSDEDDDGDDGKKAKADFQPQKKRTRIRYNSSSSDEDGKPKKRKRGPRLKPRKKTDGDNDGDSPSKGRKNIRKLLKKGDLEETTKNAEQEERERKQRIADRQKLYNQVYDEKPEVATTLDQLVLDFDEETKKPLLEVDKKLVKLLKPHQANGIKFMFDACFESLEQMKDNKGSGCILAHCMGLGKTLQVVTLTHTLLANSELTGVERVLIVCPLSTVLNWANEFYMWMKHVKKGTEVEVYEISKYKDNVMRANKLMEWHNEGGVMIMGYDMFRNLANPTASRIRKKVRESLQTSLIDPGPELIVCDEGHLLKNEKTSLSQAVNRITTMRRIVLTGTPIQNNMKEYFCMVQFVKPKLLGTYNEYMNRFVNPITNGQYTDSTPYDIQLMRKRAHVLHKLLDGCVQRRDYSVLAPFLPPKLEFVVSIKLTPLQSTLYKYYMENLAGKRLADDPMQKRSSMLFTDFQNLQRIWTHPRVLRYNSDRYEINQQRKRDLDSENESEGSMKDFIDDVSDEESAASTPPSSDDDSDVQSVHDENSKDGAKSSEESSSSKQKAVSTRSTRNNPGANALDDGTSIDKKENPTEWWMQMCPETELDILEHSGKLVVLMEILKECEAIGDKLLVFSQSLYSLDVIEHFLALLDENMQKDEEDRDEQLSKYPASWSLGLDYFRLDGSTSIDNRNDACKVFNDESNTRARLFLISTRAGGLGINLVAANRVVIFDVSWNPSHDIQSIFRVYRFGQNKPCYIYRFIAMGTMEEKIYERQVTKQAISKRVIDEQQIDRHYKENDLQELYRYDVEPSEPRPMPNLPKDRLFAELLQRFDPLIYKYHEHDSLLENKEEETLNEEERKAAWEEFEQEKNRPPVSAYVSGAFGMGGMGGRGNVPVTSSTTYGFRNDVLLKLLNIKAREDNPSFNDATINAMIPFMMQQLTMQMKEGELTLYKSLWDLYYKLEVPSAAVAQQYATTYNTLQPGMAVGQQQIPFVGQQHQQQMPMMTNVMGTGSNMHYQMNPNQTGVRPTLQPQFPMSQPGISGMHRFGPVGGSGPGVAGTVPIENRGPVTIDPNVVELD